MLARARLAPGLALAAFLASCGPRAPAEPPPPIVSPPVRGESTPCDTARGLVEKAQDLATTGRLERARLTLVQAEGLCPGPITWVPLLALLGDLGRTTDVKALAARALADGETAGAAQAALKRVEAPPADPRAREASAETYAQALRFMRRGELERARYLFLQAWNAGRPHGPALAGAAAAEKALGHDVEARILFSRALADFDEAGAGLTIDVPDGFCFPMGELSPDGELVAVKDCDGISIRRARSLVEELHLDRDVQGRRALAFSPDGKMLAAGSPRGALVFDLVTGRQIAALSGKTPLVQAVAFSPDGRELAAGTQSDERGVLTVWDLAAQKPRLELSAKGVSALRYAPDNRTLVAVSYNSVLFWDMPRGKPVKRRQPSPLLINTIAFSADSRTLAMTGFGESETIWLGRPSGPFPRTTQKEEGIQVWDVPSRTLRGSLIERIPNGGAAPGWEASPAAISADGTKVAAALIDRPLRVWNVSPWKLEATAATSPREVRALAFAGPETVVASSEGGLSAWRSGVQAWHTGATSQRELYVAPDGYTAVSSDGLALRAWETGSLPWKERAAVASHTAELSGTIAISPDSRFLAAAAGRNLLVWDLARGTARQPVSLGVDRIAFTPDGAGLVVRGRKDRVWSFHDGDLGSTELGAATELDGRAATFSPNGQVVVLASDDGADLRAAAAQKPGVKLADSRFHDYYFTFSPSGRVVAGVGYQGAKLWDAQTGAVLPPLEGAEVAHEAPLAFSPDGATIAAGSGSAGVRLWDAVTRKERTPAGDRGDAKGVVFSPDGALIVSWGTGSPRLWDPASGRELGRLPGAPERDAQVPVWDLAYSPDGRFIAGVTRNEIVFWKMPERELAATLRVRPHYASSYVFTRAGAIEFLGDAPDARTLPRCRAGAQSFDYDLCEQRFETTGLLARLFGHRG